MKEAQNTKKYDLEDRTFAFAKLCRDFTHKLKKTTANNEYSRQLIRSSGSQAANYIEANESLSKKDFAHRVKICRKETKESCLWLKLVELESSLEAERSILLKEASELRNIFTVILNKTNV